LIPVLLRENLPVLFKKLRLLLKLKSRTVIPLSLFLLLLLFAGILAITQESPDDDSLDSEYFDEDLDNFFDNEFDDEFDDEGFPPVWAPPGPPRWFRSNAGGMTLEEIPSRMAALRNEYAVVIDYLSPDELEPFLLPFFRRDYSIEIRVLYEQGEEYRRQWLFLDESGKTRLNAVLLPRQIDGDGIAETPEPAIAGLATADGTDAADLVEAGEDALSAEIDGETRAGALAFDTLTHFGFVEIYNENSRIVGDYLFLEDGGELLISYFYNEGTLVKAETERRVPGGDYQKIHTDLYRYNRSFSLRHVERLYHEAVDAEPVRLLFPYRVLDAAANDNFITEQLAVGSDFFGEQSLAPGFRMVYDTDPRGRILKQTLIDNKEQAVWVLTNTWVGDRISAIRKVEGSEEWLTQYDYDGEGKRIEQRDLRNGELERLVRINGDKETEELYMNGVLVMRAFWEDGRKIAEERVRSAQGRR